MDIDSNGNIYVDHIFGGAPLDTIPIPGKQLTGIDDDADGNLYIADQTDHVIHKFDSDGNPITSWGSSGSDDGQFSYPSAVRVSGDLVLVSDRLNARVQVFDRDGNFLTKWGESGAGEGQFNAIWGIDVAPDGRIFVSELNNFRLSIFGPLALGLCEFQVEPRRLDVDANASDESVMVEASCEDCPWTAIADVDWIDIADDADGAAGVGSAELHFSIEKNEDEKPRKGKIIVAGRRVTIRQLGADPTGDAPEAPKNFSGKARNSKLIALSWKDAAKNEIGFKLVCRDRLNGTKERFELPANQTSFVHRGLLADTRYCYWLEAVGLDGASTRVRTCARTR